MAARLIVGEEVSLPQGSLLGQLIATCEKDSGRICLEDGRTRRSVTFGELLSDCGGISSALRALGQTSGKIVTVVSDPTIESTKFLFGTWFSGAATSCINPKLPIEELRNCMEGCRSEVVYCGEHYLERVLAAVAELPWEVTIVSPQGRLPTLNLFSWFQNDDKQGLQLEGFWTGPDHLLCILYTSGTTAAPKGVLITDQSLKFNINLKDLLWTEKTRFLQTTPMYWISYTLCITVTIAIGCTLIFAHDMPPEELLKTITICKPTEWFAGPAILMDVSNVENLSQYDTSSLEGLCIGGSVVLAEHRSFIIQRLLGNRNIVRVMYGSTEAGMVSYDTDFVPINSPRFTSIGKVSPGVTIKVIDTESGKILPPHTTGEICVKSPGVLKQYLNRALTENEMDAEGFWHMGDLGYYDEEGYLFYMSRMKDVMKFRGQQIAPVELEIIINMHPDVIESCVVGKPCAEQGGDLPAAFVVKKENAILTEQQLNDFVVERVINEKKLRGGIYFVESLPRSDVGKLLRNELQKKLIGS